MQLPPLEVEFEEVQEKNARLAYEVGQMEDPALLLERLKSFPKLHHPHRDEVHVLGR